MSSRPQPFHQSVCIFAKNFRVCRGLIGARLGRLPLVAPCQCDVRRTLDAATQLIGNGLTG